LVTAVCNFSVDSLLLSPMAMIAISSASVATTCCSSVYYYYYLLLLTISNIISWGKALIIFLIFILSLIIQLFTRSEFAKSYLNGMFITATLVCLFSCKKLYFYKPMKTNLCHNR
jgi:hypothetical protein